MEVNISLLQRPNGRCRRLVTSVVRRARQQEQLLAALGHFLSALGRSGAGLGHFLAALGRSWDALGCSWDALRSLLGALWPLLAALGPLLERGAKINQNSMPKIIDLDVQKPSKTTSTSSQKAIQHLSKKRSEKEPN